MAEPDPGRIRRPRLVVAWLLTLAIIAFALLDGDDRDAATVIAPGDDGAGGEKLRIAALSDAEVVPGDAVVVTVRGAAAGSDQPLEARVGKRHAEILSEKGDRVVVRIPADLPAGKSSMRIVQGDRRSKPHDLLVRPLRSRKVVRNLIGGLALLVVGLGFFSRGLRGLAGRGLRAVFERFTNGTARGVAAGAVLGGVTQMTTAAAGATIGFLEARLLALPAAVALLFGAHLGAAATGIFLPVALGRESLLVVAAGAVWITAAADRRSESVGHTLLGFGFLLYGLHLCRLAFDPLVADPHIIGYVESLQASSVEGRLAWMAAGVLLAVVLQGPAPVFALVLALAQTSGALGVSQALALLAGTDLGAGLLVLIVSRSASQRARPLGPALVLLGAAATLLAVATLDLWIFLADALVSGRADEVAHGEKILLPHVGVHLAIAFVLQKVATTTLLAGLVPWVARRARDWRSPPDVRPGTHAAPAELAAEIGRDLSRVMAHDRLALAAILDVCRNGDRAVGAEAERALGEARRTLEAVFARVVGLEVAEPPVERIRRAVITLLQLQLTLEDLLRLVERNVEVNLILLPDDVVAVEGLHRLVVDGIDALDAGLETGGTIDLEQARAREIQLNAREAEAREALVRSAAAEGRGRPRDTTNPLSTRVGLTDLLHAYENIGNPLYRVCQTLVTDVRTAGDWSPRRGRASPPVAGGPG